METVEHLFAKFLEGVGAAGTQGGKGVGTGELGEAATAFSRVGDGFLDTGTVGGDRFEQGDPVAIERGGQFIADGCCGSGGDASGVNRQRDGAFVAMGGDEQVSSRRVVGAVDQCTSLTSLVGGGGVHSRVIRGDDNEERARQIARLPGAFDRGHGQVAQIELRGDDGDVRTCCQKGGGAASGDGSASDDDAAAIADVQHDGQIGHGGSLPRPSVAPQEGC